MCWLQQNCWDTDRYLCVCDLDERNDSPRSCCDLRRSRKDKFGAALFGYENDTADMSTTQKRRYAAEIFVRRLLVVQAILFLSLGFALLIFPRQVAFTLLISDSYMEQAGYVSDPEERIAELQQDQEDAKQREQGYALKALHVALTQLFGDKTVSDAQKRAAELAVKDTLRAQVRREAETSPPLLVVSSFTRMYGSACIGFAVFSGMLRSSDLVVMNNAAVSNMMWYVAMLGGLVMSAVDRAGGTESTTFMIFSILYCSAMAFAWCAARERLSNCVHHMNTVNSVRKATQSQYSLDDDNSDSDV